MRIVRAIPQAAAACSRSVHRAMSLCSAVRAKLTRSVSVNDSAAARELSAESAVRAEPTRSLGCDMCVVGMCTRALDCIHSIRHVHIAEGRRNDFPFYHSVRSSLS